MQAHAHDLRAEVEEMGLSAEAGDALVHRIVAGWRNAELSRADMALCAFAVKLTARDAPMSAGDLDRLRAEGLDDRAIHDAVQVIGFFNYITRIADGLGVEPEEFIDRWGPANPVGAAEAGR